MAMSALAVAELSDEPIYVGVGSSSQNMVEQWHGTPFAQPYQRVRDTVRFLRAAFAGRRITLHGDSFEIDGFRLARVSRCSGRIRRAYGSCLWSWDGRTPEPGDQA